MAIGATLWAVLPGLFSKFPSLRQAEERVFSAPGISAEHQISISRDTSHLSTGLLTPEPDRFQRRQFHLDPETLSILRTPALEPQHWAFLLDSLRRQGSTGLLLPTHLSWENADELALRTLEHQISTFRHAVLGLEVERSLRPSDLPDYLRASTLPLPASPWDQVPEINEIPTPPSIRTARFGFRDLGTETRGIPLIARWNDRLLPSLHLAWLLELSPDEVPLIRLGKDITLGGLIIPIDQSGAWLPPNLEASSSNPTSTLLLAETPGRTPPGLVTIITPEDPEKATLIPDQIALLATRTLREKKTFPALSLPWRAATLLALFLCLFPGQNWLLVFPLLLPLTASWQCAHWIPWLPIITPISIVVLGKAWSVFSRSHSPKGLSSSPGRKSSSCQ